MEQFERAFRTWFRHHAERSRGERRRRLLERYGEAEISFLRNVWYPAFGSLEGLSPEHEAIDAEGKTRFLDHAFFASGFMWDLEIDGYGPHLRDIDRRQFADERRRDVALQIVGWRVARFSYDDVVEKPWISRRLLERCLALPAERDAQTEALLYYAMARGGEITVGEARETLRKSDKPTLAKLRQLVRDGWLEPVSVEAKRVHRYRVRTEALGRRWGRGGE
ncbi:hypothetical protein [Paenibacillus sp.]|uniref:hypothetical protein n=1 Tax=Paenibacillus sp. TaxID=58172 RepID=UPI002D611F9C|nr:hypothetical protein [Paenibacillus sp.]HZG85073.1 hypothetical protein [Paenibacillus sp.]